MTLTLLGLGPGSIDDISMRGWRTVAEASLVCLRTERHPCVPHLPAGPEYRSFDALYEQYADFADVYTAIIDQVMAVARERDVVYAVPGDPFVGEATTGRLIALAQEESIPVEVVSGISFIEPMLRSVQVDALDGLQILDGLILAAQHHPPINPEYPALIAQVYSRDVASNIKLTLMNQYPDDFAVQLIHGAGTAQAHAEALPLYEIDRSTHINHLTSLYLPPLGPYTSFEAFQEIIAHLRAPEGCPWDRKQTHQSLRPYLIEEAYEVLEAIDRDDPQALAGELGDLLLQIVLHTQIAIEDGEFYMTDVLEYVNRKMIRRHPHVWGQVDVADNPDRVVANWEQIKQSERTENGDSHKSLLDGIPAGLPALMVAYKYTARAAKVGFDWPDLEGVRQKAQEEMAEILTAESDAHQAQEIGDLIFVLVNWLRWLDVEDPESLLREVNQKFYRRFQYVETHASRPLADLTLADMDALWDDAKALGL